MREENNKNPVITRSIDCSAIGPLIGGMVEDAGLEAASWQRLQSIVVATMAISLAGHAPGSDTPA